MKILFISPSYYPHVGGVEYIVKSVAERLTRIGHEVAILAGEPDIKGLYEEIKRVRVLGWLTWSLETPLRT